MSILEEYYNAKRKQALPWVSIIWFIFAVLCYIVSNGIVSFLSNNIVSFIQSKNPTASTPGQPADPLFEQISLVVSILLSGIFSTFSIHTLYVWYLKCIDEELWKKKYPQYDISGTWIDETTYTFSFDANGFSSTNNTMLPSPIVIEQSCHRIVIKPSIGDFFTWKSIVASFEDCSNLHILYEVDYKTSLQSNNKFPERRYGYEQVHVDTSKLLPHQKPTIMEGKFWHCIQKDGKPLYMGDVKYTRKEVSP